MEYVGFISHILILFIISSNMIRILLISLGLIFFHSEANILKSISDSNGIDLLSLNSTFENLLDLYNEQFHYNTTRIFNPQFPKEDSQKFRKRNKRFAGENEDTDFTGLFNLVKERKNNYYDPNIHLIKGEIFDKILNEKLATYFNNNIKTQNDRFSIIQYLKSLFSSNIPNKLIQFDLSIAKNESFFIEILKLTNVKFCTNISADYDFNDDNEPESLYNLSALPYANVVQMVRYLTGQERVAGTNHVHAHFCHSLKNFKKNLWKTDASPT